MKRSPVTLAAVAGLALLGACSAVVTPPAADAGGDVITADLPAPQDVLRTDGPAACVFSNGARCEVGQVCPSPDGCNTCMCFAGGMLGCTTRGCVDAGAPGCRLMGGGVCPRGQRCPAGDGCNTCVCGVDGSLSCTEIACVDAGARGCSRDQDCGAGVAECIFAVGACGAPGRCAPISDCALVATFCGCDGQSFQGCPGRPGRPARAAGACETDGGARPDVACVGEIAPMGNYCAGPNDGPLPVECCTGWSCDPRRVACNALPPTCPAGYVAAVAGACWGPCVPAANCAPMRCLGAALCPPGWRCNDADTCELAPR